MKITVFGSARPTPGDPDYSQAMQLGQMIARGGHTVLTGGYVGTMEAVSRGANEAGGHVIGVTCDEVEKYRPGSANPWVIEEWHFRTLFERLHGLIDRCDTAIALPGGPGTFTEITLYWNLLLLGAIQPKPLVLIGAGWQKVFDEYRSQLGAYVADHDWEWLIFVPDIQTALSTAVNTKVSNRSRL